jgi:hypothetical protein
MGGLYRPWGGHHKRVGKDRKGPLFEKRSKNFRYWARDWARASPERARPISKSFLVLFFKKELFSFLARHQ